VAEDGSGADLALGGITNCVNHESNNATRGKGIKTVSEFGDE
jgi:hypothetical protein